MNVDTLIERVLERSVAGAEEPGAPPMLGRAIRHSVFPGGARVRPKLCVAVAAACGEGRGIEAASGAGAALELMHCASLVHDDLPAFDGAAIRRGKPSVHAAYGEAIAVLASIITVHECGHFFAARLQNIHVSKFSVGFGPNLLSYKGPEVEYSLRWVPLGGFVAFPDDDPDCPYPEDDPDLLRNRPIKDRAIVITAGVLANVAFALAILNYQVNTVGLVEQAYRPGVKVAQLLSTSAAREYGVKVGDVITAIDGESLPAAGRSVNDVVAKVKAAGSNPVRLKIDRLNAPPVDIEVVPKTGVNGEGRIGVQLEANAEVRKRIASDPAEGLFLASKEFGRLTGLVCKSLFSLVSNFSQAKDNVSGPIAIVGVGAEVMRGADASGLYQFASVININLAVVNILPLPALDGGFLLLIVIEALRGGKKLPAEVEQSITASGVLLLLGSGMFLILRDTLNLVGNLGQH